MSIKCSSSLRTLRTDQDYPNVYYHHHHHDYHHRHCHSLHLSGCVSWLSSVFLILIVLQAVGSWEEIHASRCPISSSFFKTWLLLPWWRPRSQYSKSAREKSGTVHQGHCPNKWVGRSYHAGNTNCPNTVFITPCFTSFSISNSFRFIKSLDKTKRQGQRFPIYSLIP